VKFDLEITLKLVGQKLSRKAQNLLFFFTKF